MGDIEVKYSSRGKQPLTAQNLKTKGWWRFAQVIFVLGSILLFALTLLFAGAAISETTPLVPSESSITCNNGQVFNLKSFDESLNIYTYGFSPVDSNGRFTDYSDDATAKMFCTALNRDRFELSPLPEGSSITPARKAELDAIIIKQLQSQTQEEWAANMTKNSVRKASYSDLEDIHSRETSKQGENMGYSIDAKKDYSEVFVILGFFVLALIIEAGLLFVVRGIVRYTLISKFF